MSVPNPAHWRCGLALVPRRTHHIRRVDTETIWSRIKAMKNDTESILRRIKSIEKELRFTEFQIKIYHYLFMVVFVALGFLVTDWIFTKIGL